MTDRLSGDFLDAAPVVGEHSYGLFYPYDGALDLRYDNPEDAWDWYQTYVMPEDNDESYQNAYVVRVQIERVEADK